MSFGPSSLAASSSCFLNRNGILRRKPFERTSEPNLCENARKLGRTSPSNRKSELSVSFRSTERVGVKRLPCRNFELRYLKPNQPQHTKLLPVWMREDNTKDKQ